MNLNKKNVLVLVLLLIVIVLWVLLARSKKDVSDLNKRIDYQESLISEHCWVCKQAQSDLKLLYSEKKNLLSGFTSEIQ